MGKSVYVAPLLNGKIVAQDGYFRGQDPGKPFCLVRYADARGDENMQLFRDKDGAVERVGVYDLTRHDTPLLDNMSSRLTEDVSVYWPWFHGRVVGLCIPNNTVQVEYECFVLRGN